jgi:hypothetical protein
LDYQLINIAIDPEMYTVIALIRPAYIVNGADEGAPSAS